MEITGKSFPLRAIRILIYTPQMLYCMPTYSLKSYLSFDTDGSAAWLMLLTKMLLCIKEKIIKRPSKALFQKISLGASSLTRLKLFRVIYTLSACTYSVIENRLFTQLIIATSSLLLGEGISWYFFLMNLFIYCMHRKSLPLRSKEFRKGQSALLSKK